jgi:hypothetical protein
LHNQAVTNQRRSQPKETKQNIVSIMKLNVAQRSGIPFHNNASANVPDLMSSAATRTGLYVLRRRAIESEQHGEQNLAMRENDRC